MKKMKKKKKLKKLILNLNCSDREQASLIEELATNQILLWEKVRKKFSNIRQRPTLL